MGEGLRRESGINDVLLRRVLHWTGGHPYLTQRLCRSVVEDSGAVGVEDVDRLCDKLFFSHRAREQEPNLTFVAAQFLGRVDDLGGLLALYRGP